MDLARELLKTKIDIREIREEMADIRKGNQVPNYTKGMVTMQELADMAECDVSTIRRRVKEGKIAVKFPNAKRCITPEAALNYLQGR